MDQKKGSNCTECEGVRVRTCLPQQAAAHEIEKTMYHTSHLLKLPCVSHLYSSRYWQRPSMSTVTVHQRYSPHPHFCILPFPHLISLLIATFCTLRSTSFFPWLPTAAETENEFRVNGPNNTSNQPIRLQPVPMHATITFLSLFLLAPTPVYSKPLGWVRVGGHANVGCECA